MSANPETIVSLREWVNGPRDYWQGWNLLKAFSQETGTVAMLERQQLPEKLFQKVLDLYLEMKESAEHQPASVVVTGNEVSVRVKSVRANSVEKQLLEQRNDLMAQMDIYKTNLGQIGRDDNFIAHASLTNEQIEKRHALAKLIVDTRKKITAIYINLDYYHLNGKLPDSATKEEKAPSLMNDVEKERRYKNQVLPQISKLKKKLKDNMPLLDTLKGKQLKKLQQDLNKWEAQLRDYENERDEYNRVK